MSEGQPRFDAIMGPGRVNVRDFAPECRGFITTEADKFEPLTKSTCVIAIEQGVPEVADRGCHLDRRSTPEADLCYGRLNADTANITNQRISRPSRQTF